MLFLADLHHFCVEKSLDLGVCVDTLGSLVAHVLRADKDAVRNGVHQAGQLLLLPLVDLDLSKEDRLRLVVLVEVKLCQAENQERDSEAVNHILVAIVVSRNENEAGKTGNEEKSCQKMGDVARTHEIVAEEVEEEPDKDLLLPHVASDFINEVTQVEEKEDHGSRKYDRWSKQLCQLLFPLLREPHLEQ